MVGSEAWGANGVVHREKRERARSGAKRARRHRKWIYEPRRDSIGVWLVRVGVRGDEVCECARELGVWEHARAGERNSTRRGDGERVERMGGRETLGLVGTEERVQAF